MIFLRNPSLKKAWRSAEAPFVAAKQVNQGDDGCHNHQDYQFD